MLTCTWAPTVFARPQLVAGAQARRRPPEGAELTGFIRQYAARIEALGLSHLLIAQRWWGSAQEIEGSSLDCTAMTAFFAAWTESINLVTAIHPGFFQPTAMAKWGATIDQMTGGRWSINVTSGWNTREFNMYGIDWLDHDQRYARSREFIDVLRMAWSDDEFSYEGQFYSADGLQMEPRPTAPLNVFQGGQSEAAMSMAATHSDWMFLNGGSVEKTENIIRTVRTRADAAGRTVRFALYAHPLCQPTDAQAWREIDDRVRAIDPTLRQRRRESVSGAEGMWSNDDDLSQLDTNEGYASRLIGSPDSVIEQVEAFRDVGVDMLHLALDDTLFEEAVLPAVIQM